MPRARANGIEIEYEAIGTGEPLLLIMGIGAQLIVWPDGFCEMLAEKGFQVIRFDNRDTGLSTHLDDQPAPHALLSTARRLLGLPVKAPYTLSDMAADAAGLLGALGLEQAHVVGMSLGGMIAQTMAIEHPDRVQTLTSFASSTGSLWPLGRPRALLTLISRPPRDREASIQNGLRFQRVCGSTGFAWSEARSREIWGACYDRDFSTAGFLRQMAAVMASGSREERLGQVRCPTLVLHGLADPLLRPACAMATARAIPGARLRFIDGLGHDLPEGAWPILVDAITDHARS